MRMKSENETNRLVIGLVLLVCAACLMPSQAISADKSEVKADSVTAQPTLEETRLRMEKWIETQQIISKERKDWQQGKDILTGRLELVKKEVVSIDEKTKQAQSSVAETEKKRNDLIAENDQLKAAGTQLAENIKSIEGEIRRIYKQLPEPIQTKLQPLYQRIPEDPNKTRVSVAERFQNVLGILNEVNKANNEISVSYEVHNLADGKPSEVKVIYVGLAQAYYVSARGEAGIGHPATDGWKWEPSKESARDILIALEILQGKQTPAFVPLPVKIK
jgi:FtsZ-binding cell division protein ZapB